MSVSLLEVLENAGYDILNNYEDSVWFLSKQSEIEDLLEQVQSYVDDAEEDKSL